MTSVINERLARLLAPDVHLQQGKGSGANGTISLCMMQAADWITGGDGKTDSPPCVARSITHYCIRLNDSQLFAEHLDLLKPYAPKVVGTKTTVADEIKRGFIAADYACRVIAPIWLRALGKDEWARKCEALTAITDKTSAWAGRAALRKIQRAAVAAAASYVADAAANATWAAAAAYVADAAAYAAWAAYAAYGHWAADAAAAANTAWAAGNDAARRTVYASHGDQLRAAAFKCLDDLIAVGKVAA